MGFELDAAYGRSDVSEDLLAVRCVGAMALARLHHVLEPPLWPLPDGLALSVEDDSASRIPARLM